MNAQAEIATQSQADPRPPSAVSAGVGLAGLAGLFAWVAIARAFGFSGQWGALAALVACGAPMVLWSVLVFGYVTLILPLLGRYGRLWRLWCGL